MTGESLERMQEASRKHHEKKYLQRLEEEAALRGQKLALMQKKRWEQAEKAQSNKSKPKRNKSKPKRNKSKVQRNKSNVSLKTQDTIKPKSGEVNWEQLDKFLKGKK